MADIQHSAITDPNIHEPKGVASAQAGQVYFADGSGSGDWMFPSGHAYGELYITNNSTSQNLAASSATAKLNPTSAWQTNGAANVTQSAANGQMTVLKAGEYQLSFWVSFNTAAIASGAKYYFHYAVNGTASSRRMFIAKTTNGVETHHISATGLASLSENDVVSIYVGGDATSSGTAITPVEAGLVITLIDPS